MRRGLLLILIPVTVSSLYDREVAPISANGSVSLQPEANAYSGDKPRAVITADGTQFYMAGNSDSTIAKDGTGPGTTIGARYGTPGSNQSIQLGVYFASDRPDESAKKHLKDNNSRIFQVHEGSGNGLPTGTGNTITELLGEPATDPNTGANAALTLFGFWFANQTTLSLRRSRWPADSKVSFFDRFITLQQPKSGDVFRGVAFAPCAFCGSPNAALLNWQRVAGVGKS